MLLAKIILAIFLVSGSLWAQESTFLSETRVMQTFLENNIEHPLLLSKASKIDNELTLKTLIKMHGSGILFDDGSWNRVINERKAWVINDNTRQLISDLLQRPSAKTWFIDNSVSSVSFVTNDYHRRLALHFVELYEKLPLTARQAQSFVDYPAYFLGDEVSSFYKGLNSEAALNLVKEEFKRFPSDELSITHFQKQSDSFLNYIDLARIDNEYQAKFARKILNNLSTLKEVQRKSGLHPGLIFSNNFDKLYDQSSMKIFDEVLEDYLVSSKFDVTKINAIPDGCNRWFLPLP